MGGIFRDSMLMKFISTTDITSSDNECYLVKFCELVYFMNEFFDMIMVKSVTLESECLTGELEKETHKREVNE